MIDSPGRTPAGDRPGEGIGHHDRQRHRTQRNRACRAAIVGRSGVVEDRAEVDAAGDRPRVGVDQQFRWVGADRRPGPIRRAPGSRSASRPARLGRRPAVSRRPAACPAAMGAIRGHRGQFHLAGARRPEPEEAALISQAGTRSWTGGDPCPARPCALLEPPIGGQLYHPCWHVSASQGRGEASLFRSCGKLAAAPFEARAAMAELGWNGWQSVRFARGRTPRQGAAGGCQRRSWLPPG